ncbi:MAG: Asd/ArgC dimerization domain-containing protein [Pseudomonadota bacterium]
MSERKLRVGVAGATGAVGRQIVELLQEADLPIGAIVPMASPACTVDHLEIGGRHVRVENLLVEHIQTCDVLVCAVPPKAAVGALRSAREAGVPAVDLSGTLGPRQGVPLVVPAVGRAALHEIRDVLAVASPQPDVVALTTLLAPLLAGGGNLGVRGTVMHSAAAMGRAGVEELSNQVVSLFNSRSPTRKVFPQGLAFDVLPSLGEPAVEGWTADERRCAEQSAALLGLQPDQVVLSSLVGPWFNGLCLALQIEPEPALDAEGVRALLAGAPGITLTGALARELPHPRGVDGSAALHVGRLRDDPGGRCVHLWAVADELRFGAAANVVAILAALIEDDLLG